MIVFKHQGSFKNTERFLTKVQKADFLSILDQYGRLGVDALRSMTPVESGETADSWSYEVFDNEEFCGITWSNSNVVDGVPIAIVLQYGHATRNGGFVAGQDYINPALQPIFDDLTEALWKEVTRA